MPLSIEAPGDAYAAPPAVPSLAMAPPTTGTAVVPVAGPRGQVGGTGAMAYVYTSVSPSLLHQVQHGLSFKPSVTCFESDGTQIEPASITHPSPGITEVTFGVPVTVEIDLS